MLKSAKEFEDALKECKIAFAETVNNADALTDEVNHPSHYTDGNIECIDYIQDKLTKEEFQGYCKGNALKYISRAGKKNPDKYNEDLKKAIWYLERAAQSGS